MFQFLYNTHMKTKPLTETNPYLKDASTRERLVERSVATSCGVEGVKVDFQKVAHIEIPRRRNKKIFTDI